MPVPKHAAKCQININLPTIHLNKRAYKIIPLERHSTSYFLPNMTSDKLVYTERLSFNGATFKKK